MPVSVRILADDAAALVRRYQAAAPIVRGLIKRGLDEENLNTVSRIQASKLTAAGPQYLNVRTGRLRHAARAALATIEGSTIRSSIGANLPYARAHEFGFTGNVQVRPFLRRLPPKAGPRGGKGKRPAKPTVQVRGFVRKVDMRARHMFTDGINEAVAAGGYQTRISDYIRAEFGRAVSRPPRPFPE